MFTSGPNRLRPRASRLRPDTSTGHQPASVRPKPICSTVAARFVSGSNINTLFARPELGAAVATGVTLGPALLSSPASSWRGDDWHYFQHQAHIAWQSFAHGVWPDHNPWHCAGFDMAGNPQGLEGHPLFALVGLLGPSGGLRAACWLHAALGAALAARLGGQLGLSPLARLWVGCAWGLLPWWSIHISEGHVPFAAFALLPGVMSAWLRCGTPGNPRAWLELGLWLGWMLLFGGVYPVAFSGLAIAATWLAAPWAQARARAVALAAAAGTAAALAAPKLLPAMAALLEFPREPLWSDGLTRELVLPALFSREVATGCAVGHPYDLAEYIVYPGVGVLAFAAVGLWLRRKTRLGATFGLLVALGAALALGHSIGPLAALVEALPVLGDLQVPSRFAVLGLLGLIMLAAFGLEAFVASRRSAVRGVALATAVLAVAELGSLSVRWLEAAETSEPARAEALEAPLFSAKLQHYDTLLDQAPARRVVLQPCYEPMSHRFAPALERPEPVPFARNLSSAHALDVTLASPREWRIRGVAPGDILELAQTCSPHFWAVGAELSCSSGGIVRAEVKAEDMRVGYTNPLRQLGQSIQGAAVLALGVGAWAIRRRVNAREAPRPPA